jgi:hypothetical protein
MGYSITSMPLKAVNGDKNHARSSPQTVKNHVISVNAVLTAGVK